MRYYKCSSCQWKRLTVGKGIKVMLSSSSQGLMSSYSSVVTSYIMLFSNEMFITQEPKTPNLLFFIAVRCTGQP